MSIPESFKDEVRSRVAISTLIGRDVPLTKAGNEWKARCPFHDEKTASFWVNDQKGFYHCFGCAAHGDAMTWLMEKHGLPFIDALRELATSVGMTLPERSAGEQAREERDTGLHAVMERAVEWYAANLASAEGERARAYLKSRGFNDEVVRAWKVGWAPDSRTGVRKALADDGDAQLVACGLLIEVEGQAPYDRFRGRIMFPVRDARGRCTAFSGRILGAGEPKYLNSPDTPIFDKGRSLFGIDKALAAARKVGRVLVVEGNLDVVGWHRIGLEETVAPLGTAVTVSQLARLWKLADVPVLCFDGDKAGRAAAVRVALRALPMLTPGRSLRFALLPEGTDPDDIARTGGKGEAERLIRAAMPLDELIWSHEFHVKPLHTPEERAGLAARLDAHAAAIEHTTVSQEYARTFRDRLFHARIRRSTQAVRPIGADHRFDPARLERKMIVATIKGLARHPDIAMEKAERVAMMRRPDEEVDGAVNALLADVFGAGGVSYDEVAARFPADRGALGLWFGFMREKHDKPADRDEARRQLGRYVDHFAGYEVDPEVEIITEGPVWVQRQAAIDFDDGPTF